VIDSNSDVPQVRNLPLPDGVKLRTWRWGDFAVSPDAKWAVLVCHRTDRDVCDSLLLLEVETGEMWILEHEEPCSLAFSPDSRFLAACSMTDDGIRVWSVPSFELHQEFEPNAIATYGLAFTSTGTLLSAGGDSRVYENALPGGELMGMLRSLRMLGISQDGEHLAVLTNDGMMRLWKLGTTCELVQEFRSDVEYKSVGWMSGHWLIAEDQAEVIRVWDCRTLELAAVVNGDQMELHDAGMEGAGSDKLSTDFWGLMRKTNGKIARMGMLREYRNIHLFKLHGVSSGPDAIGAEIHHPDLGVAFWHERAGELTVSEIQNHSGKLVSCLAFGNRISIVQFERG
jgi:WD40 repeat protein